jgi:hypothetical protein
MSDRYPLIANSETNRIEELASGDNLNLDNSGIVGASTITAEKFVGDLEGTAQFADALVDATQILSGIVSASRLSGFYDIGVGTAINLENAENILSGIVSTSRLAGSYDIDITGTAQTANFLNDAGNINDGIIDAERLTGVYNINITGTASSALSVSPGTYDIDITGISSFSVISGYSTNSGISSFSQVSGYSTNSGISSFSQVSGVSTLSTNSLIGISAPTVAYYPTFVSGSGTKNLNINPKFSVIPSSGRLGVNTISPEVTLDVRGDIAFDGFLYAPTDPVGLGTTTGVLSSANRAFIGVNTTGLIAGDLVLDIPQARIFSGTFITSVGIGSIGLSQNHVVLIGSETRGLSFSRPVRVSVGTTNQVLVSRGTTAPPTWIDPTNVISVGVEQSTADANLNVVVTPQNTGTADLRVDSSGISYNPSRNILNVSGVVKSPEFVGNLVGIASTTIDVIGGIASVSQLNVSGVSTLGIVTATSINVANNVIASAFIGDGNALSGIVKQITAGIGVNVTPINGRGNVTIDAYRPTGKTIFVNQNGNNANTGLSENHAKRTIKGAATVAVFGDTIKVYPGVYVEDNPIVLKKTVSVEGTELRNCVVTPRYPYLDLFHVNNGCHITDLSFIGPDMIDGAAVVALQPLEGVAVDRFFDAARMIRLNLDYIANETVGFLTSGFSGFAGNHREQDAARLIDKNIDYIATEAVGFLTSSSGLNFTVPTPGTTGDCADDIKDIFRSVSYDLKANSNKKSIGAALSYFGPDGELLHITGVGVSEATISTLEYAVGIAYSVINNTIPPQSYQTGVSSVTQVIDPSVIFVEGGCVAVGDTISQLVGIITSAIGVGNTSILPDVRFGVTLESGDCSDDIKDIWKCVIHDITRGGNSRCVGAGNAYYDDDWNLIPQILKNPGEVEQTVASVDYSFNVARAIINNVTWGGYPMGDKLDVVNADYNEFTGITTITVDNHGLIKDDAVKITELEFNCPSGLGIVTYPSGTYGYIFNVLNVIDEDNFEVVVGQSTLPHNYVIGGKVQKYTSFQDNFYQVKDLGMQSDPLTGFNNAITGCANVASALHSCVGIVTNIVGLGSDAFNVVGIKTTYPGNSGIGFTSVLNIQNAVYDEISGKTVITAPNVTAIVGEPIEIRDLAFSCGSTGGISTQFFPSGAYGYDFIIDKINDDGTFEVYVGPSTLPHTYVGGGVAVNRNVAVTTATYNNITGITTIQAEGLSIETGDLITIRNLEFSCPSGSGTTTIYPTGNSGFNFKVLDIVVDKPIAISTAVYNNVTGIVTITAPGILVDYDGLVEIRDLEFTCPDSPPNLLYPTGNNGYEFRVLSSIGSTFTVNVGPSTIPHTYVSGGTAIDRTQTANDTFTINVGPSTIPHTYVSGGIAIPPYSKGVGNITQGPYIRNCTNFIPNSIGMKVDGFDAEPGDQDDIGVTGTMSVDSYTQFNQGGIGVSITNGAYSQLVSIFTICDDIAIFTGSGGQCDITNSNSSFGRLGLYSNGVGDANSKSIYRSTGIVLDNVPEKTNIVEISGVGNYRPYDGQVCYFGELLSFVDVIGVIDGGSGYTVAPRVNISSPEGENGITAQASSTIENGRVVSVNIVNSGTQYKIPPVITIDPPSGPGTPATAAVTRMQPIYYTVDSATLPSAGVSTVSFLQNLNNAVSAGTTVYFLRVSLQITSSHSFEWVGSGNDINRAKPALGGVVIPENEVVQENGGRVVYTSTDQAGNFKIGDGVIINQSTGQISGRDFTKALFTTMTPFILALAE